VIETERPERYRDAVTTPPPLEPIDENWTIALAVAAHPDDLEYGAAAAVARWTAQGKRISYCLATSGEAGIDGIRPEEAGPLREREQREAAAIVGVDDVEFLGYPDGVLEYSLPLRRDIARAIRRERPQIVVIGNYRDTFGPGMLNQADHIAAGRAVIDAVRDAGNRWVFRELLDEGFEPWNGVRAVFVSGSPDAGHGVDISETFEKGIASLKAHAAYLAGLGGGPMSEPEEFLESFARMTGTRMGVKLATSFEVISFEMPEL
jgi:LmbE family N-acetylglucosaminyl deacetylase